MLFILRDHRPAIVSPASKAVRPTMTPIQRTAAVVGGGVSVRARAGVVCLQYTIMIFYPG